MDSIIHADIFFFVSTIAIVIVSIALVVALLYVIKILRDVSKASGSVKDFTSRLFRKRNSK